MRKLDFPAAALILGLVLGDVLERALRQSLMMSQGDIAILINRPISGNLLVDRRSVYCVFPRFAGYALWRVQASSGRLKEVRMAAETRREEMKMRANFFLCRRCYRRRISGSRREPRIQTEQAD